MFTITDRAVLAGLLHQLPMDKLRHLLLLVRPDTVLRWHRDLLKCRHAATCAPRRRGRPPTVRSIHALVLRLARENSSWGDRRIHGELAALGIKVAASTVWEILREHGIPPAPKREGTTWALLAQPGGRPAGMRFLRNPHADRARLYAFAAIEHANRRIRRRGPAAADEQPPAREQRSRLSDSRYLSAGSVAGPHGLAGPRSRSMRRGSPGQAVSRTSRGTCRPA
jgi:putative transposase